MAKLLPRKQDQAGGRSSFSFLPSAKCLGDIQCINHDLSISVRQALIREGYSRAEKVQPSTWTNADTSPLG